MLFLRKLVHPFGFEIIHSGENVGSRDTLGFMCVFLTAANWASPDQNGLVVKTIALLSNIIAVDPKKTSLFATVDHSVGSQT